MGKRLLSLDALLLLLLVLVRVRIDTLVTVVIPRPIDLVAQVPLLGAFLTSEAMNLLADPMADPISNLLITATFGLVLVYLLIDVLGNGKEKVAAERPAETAGGIATTEASGRGAKVYRAKLVTLYLIIFLTTGLGTLLVVGLRHVSEPARYAHDGGVLITESAVRHLLAGKNPYVETYRGTPAEKAYPNGPGLSHYAYLPYAFLSAVPFYLVSEALIGWYDQRFVYLLALALTLALVPRLAKRPGDKLALVMLVGLNPIMGNDIVYGMNDILIVLWLVLSAYLLKVGRPTLATAVLGIAVATKGTVWPILPFYLLYLLRADLEFWPKFSPSALWKVAPLAVTALAAILPFAAWNFPAMVEDAWSYNMGSTTTDPLPIKGWGLANLVLALGWVRDTMDYFPFWVFEGLFALPVLALLLFRQWRHNTLSNMLFNYGIFFLVFVYFSRTMNANYIGFAVTFAALGYFGDEGEEADRKMV